MVELDNQRIATAEMVRHQVGYLAHVCSDPQSAILVADHKPYRIAGIVRNGKRLKRQRPDLKRAPRLENIPREMLFYVGFDDRASAARCIERHMMTLRQHGDPRRVVGVIVGNTKPLDTVELHTNFGQLILDTFPADARIHENAGALRFNVNAVTAAPAGQYTKLHFTAAFSASPVGMSTRMGILTFRSEMIVISSAEFPAGTVISRDGMTLTLIGVQA